jgi:hypothetical protein
VRLPSECEPDPPAMPSDMVLALWDACRGLAGNLPGVVVPLSAGGFGRGGGGGLVEPSEYAAGAEAGEVRAGVAELG